MPHCVFGIVLTILSLLWGNNSKADEENDALLGSKNILYLTNRAPVLLENGAASYSSDRSHSLAFGSVDVFGSDIGSSVLGAPAELGRFPNTPYSLEKYAGHYIRSSSMLSEHIKARKLFGAELSKRIANSSRKEVIIFIHGYHNTFDDAVKSTAQLCNDLGGI